MPVQYGELYKYNTYKILPHEKCIIILTILGFTQKIIIYILNLLDISTGWYKDIVIGNFIHLVIWIIIEYILRRFKSTLLWYSELVVINYISGFTWFIIEFIIKQFKQPTLWHEAIITAVFVNSVLDVSIEYTLRLFRFTRTLYYPSQESYEETLLKIERYYFELNHNSTTLNDHLNTLHDNIISTKHSSLEMLQDLSDAKDQVLIAKDNTLKAFQNLANAKEQFLMRFIKRLHKQVHAT